MFNIALPPHQKVYEFPVLHAGWELDDKGWLALDIHGKPFLILTNHGSPYAAPTSEVEEKIQEYEEAIDASQHALQTLKELDPNYTPPPYCCSTFEGVVTASCEQHGKDCPDRLIRKYGIRYGIPYPGDGSFSHIKYCPYCGTKL